MLTADMVHVRRRGEILTVVPLGEAERARALALAGAYVDLARAHLGQERGAFLEACRELPVAARERRLADGLLKLVIDRCTFEEATPIDAAALRAELFTAATAARKALGPGEAFDRQALLEAAAAARQVSAETIERALYADLPAAHVLRAVDLPGPRTIVAAYEDGQIQAVLLRAVKVEAHVFAAAPATYRTLFRKLKFQRLLHQIRPRDRGYTVEIDGPFSLFDSVTKYGLQLALAFPAIAACDEWRLEADVRWGKQRTPLRFRAAGQAGGGETAPATGRADDAPATGRAEAAGGAGGGRSPARAVLPDEVAALLAQLEAAGTPWRAALSNAILELPGLGLCVPDLELVHAETGQVVFVEVLGFWSRDAVWKRVELVERGLPFSIVFAVSKHLRVSEAALGDEHPAALCVYARTLTARAILERVEAVARR